MRGWMHDRVNQDGRRAHPLVASHRVALSNTFNGTKEDEMKTILALLLSLAVSAPALALAQDVRWQDIVGVITAQNVDNPVADVDSGTFAWSTRNGQASVNLSTGASAFVVQGLVINGTVFSGTPGPVTSVTGTLVCNAGEATEAVLDTAAVSLSPVGHAQFGGRIQGIPNPCSNPLFLIRIATPAGAAGRWIATGTERFITH